MPGGKYETLHYNATSGAPTTPPNFTKVAYWDGHIVAVDDQSNSWSIAPKWDDGSYTITDKAPIDAVTEFTATDLGPVGLRSDRYLWTRVVEAPPSGSTDDATLKWTRWLKADGVTNLGVASPGVLLDMHLLTSTLRSRYVDVQTSVYPVVDRLRAFGLTHTHYLNNVATDAANWKNASLPEQQTLAITNANAFVTHAQTWSKIVSSSISSAKDNVNIMTNQLHDVRVQLEQQLTLLRDKLVGLNATLDAQEDALSKLKAAFWGTIAAMLFGVVLAIVGTVTGNPWILGTAGVLFAGGLVATIVLGSKMAELAASIADTQSQIRDVNTAIDELSTIVSSFTDLDNLYGTLNMFWGRMSSDASAIKAMDEATAIQIGSAILADTSSIEASQDMTTQMTEACQTYLDVLNKQGIHIPTGFTATSSAVYKSDSEARLNRTLLQARDSLSHNNVEAYGDFMREATLGHAQTLVESQRMVIFSGQWFDMPDLKSSADIWMHSDRAFSCAVDLPSSLRSASDTAHQVVVYSVDNMDQSLNEIRPYVQQMLTDIIGLSETIQGWTGQFPSIPTNPEDLAAVERLRGTAVTTCEQAQQKAAMSNNKFADFTNKAREYQQGLEQQVTVNQDNIKAAEAAANKEIHHLSPPWGVFIAGAPAVAEWMGEESSSINDRLNNTVNGLNSSIAQLRQLQQSGAVFDGKAQTWVDMSQAVSKDLGGVYNILTGVWGQLLENPVLYAELMHAEWAQLVGNTKEVLTILGSGTATSRFIAPVHERRLLASAPSVTSADPVTKEAILNALSPNVKLGSGIQAQAGSAQEVFTKLDLLQKSPYLKDIVGFWQDGQTDRKTLLDVVTSLRSQYVQMVATEYETIQNISSLSILQEYRARNVANGKLSLENFVQFTSQSVRAALQAAEKTSTQFGSAAKQFEVVLGVIDKNIQEITAQISNLDTNIDKLSKELRNKIIWVIADTIALSFAAAAILVSFGIVGPIAGAVTVAAQIGASAGATAASIKLVLDSLSIADLVKTIESLKALRGALNTSVTELKSVRPLFGGVVDGANELTTTITGMQKVLSDVLSNINVVGHVTFTPEDANRIKDAWVRVGEDAQTWMDIINAQGISPITV